MPRHFRQPGTGRHPDRRRRDRRARSHRGSALASAGRLDRLKKRPPYFDAGVREIWFVSPDDRRVEIHLPDTEGAALTLSAKETLTTDFLPGWSVPVAELFD